MPGDGLERATLSWSEQESPDERNKMTNAEKTRRFFAATDASTKSDVLANIASHYGISQESALEEVLDEGAEHLLDYVTGPTRAAVSVLMQRHGT